MESNILDMQDMEKSAECETAHQTQGMCPLSKMCTHVSSLGGRLTPPPPPPPTHVPSMSSSSFSSHAGMVELFVDPGTRQLFNYLKVK